MIRATALLLSMLSLPLAACETTQGQSRASTPTESEERSCDEDSPTGSHLRAPRCRSKDQRDEEKRSADQFMIKSQQQTPKGGR